MALQAVILSLPQISLVGTYLVFSIYFLVFSSFSFAFLRRLRNTRKPSEAVKKHSAISVIVAARNEQDHLPRLVEDLLNQNYPKHAYDIIIVDDHSDIFPSAYLKLNKYDEKQIRILSLPKTLSGKKAALLFASHKSDAEILAFSDADCRISPNWLSSINQEFSISKPDLIIGLVDIFPARGILQSFFRLDFLSLVTSGAGSAELGKPVFCNGANLALKRDVYAKAATSLTEQTPSGDDVFLLHEIKRRGLRIETMMTQSAVVHTMPPMSVRQFLNQRVRWASKSKYYRDMDTIILGLLVALANLVFLAAGIYQIIHDFSLVLGFAMLLKIMADCILIASGLKLFKRWYQLWVFPIAQLIYPIYILIALLTSFLGSFSWRGRNY